MSPTKDEPLVTVATITAAVSALLTLLVVFGVPLTDAQQDALLVCAAVVAPVVVGLVARRLVSPANQEQPENVATDEDGNPVYSD